MRVAPFTLKDTLLTVTAVIRNDNELNISPQTPCTVPMVSRRLGSWHVSVSRYPRSPTELASQYDAVARRWTRIVDRFQLQPAYQSALVESGIPLAINTAQGPTRILDCGIGSGSLTIALSHLLPHPARWFGIDTSRRMLESANRQLGALRLPSTLQHADIRCLPFKDRSFDVVMAAHVIEHLPEPNLALGEMLRVLKPGGRLFFAINRQSLFGALIQLRWRTWAISEQLGTKWLRDCHLDDIGHRRLRLSSYARQSSVAFWARKPA